MVDYSTCVYLYLERGKTFCILKVPVDNKKSVSLVVIVALVIAGGLGFWYWRSKKAVSTAPTTTSTTVPGAEKADEGIGAAVFEKSQNPISDKLPETNPFGANINPFEKEANPLKVQYKNPFEPR